MQQERLMTLRMLAEGKITPEEAASLLDAMGGKQETCPRTTPGEASDGLAEGLAGFAGRVASWGAEFGARVAEEIREGRVPVLRWIGDCFDGRESVTERTGRFAQDEIEVKCACEAGSFVLRGSEDKDYGLVVRQRFGHADGPVIAATDGSLSIRGNGIVRAEITLPRGLRYRLRLGSSAGRLEVADLRIDEAVIATEAGSIKLSELTAEHLIVRSSAGSIEGAGLATPDLRAETHCGRIHLDLRPAASGRCHVETDVGAISLIVPLIAEVGYRLDAQAEVGSISCDPGLTVDEDDRSVGHRRLRAESPDFAARRIQVEIEARTDCGSIRLSGRAQ